LEPRLEILGGIFKILGTYDMSSFNGRIVLQKTVYFLQAFGINLGYGFSWYWYGPYCSDLSRDSFKLESYFEEVAPIKFVSSSDEKKFRTLIDFLGDKKNDAKSLELLASIHLIKKSNHDFKKDEIITRVRNKHSYFNDEKLCLEAWKYLEPIPIALLTSM